jgi:acyl-CoA synthetase (AMP-forming)/AMP-acid ligase II
MLARVAVLAHACIEVAETFLVASKIGAIRVGLNARLATAEILALIRDCQPTVLAYTARQQRTVHLIKPDLEALKVPPVLRFL